MFRVYRQGPADHDLDLRGNPGGSPYVRTTLLAQFALKSFGSINYYRAT